MQSGSPTRGRGFAVGPARVPIVPQAILFDLLNGGDTDAGDEPPTRGSASARLRRGGGRLRARQRRRRLWCHHGDLRGGLGSASACSPDGTTVGALVAVNALGSVTIGDDAALLGGAVRVQARVRRTRPARSAFPPDALAPRLKGGVRENTTIAIVATDAALDKRQCHRLAVMAQTGLARAIYPGPHAARWRCGVCPLDRRAGRSPIRSATSPCSARVAANVLARAIARGVYHAAPSPDDRMPAAYCETVRANHGYRRGNCA